jgi:PAS domain S-box-containing protein
MRCFRSSVHSRATCGWITCTLVSATSQPTSGSGLCSCRLLPSLHGVLVFVNSAFSNLTGYSRSFATNRNYQFLQGTETEPQSVAKMRRGFAHKREVRVLVTNHTRSGKTFPNLLFMRPIFTSSGSHEVSFYMGFQVNPEVHDLVLGDKVASLFPNIFEAKSP